MSKYDSIINYDYVMKHPRMTINNRSFQFAPFSALTGYAELIKEKGRETEIKKEINEDRLNLLNYQLEIINNKLEDHPLIEITYFIKDKTKDGGSYNKITNYIKKIDFYHKIIILENNERIKIENIIDITSLDINFDNIL